MIVNKGYDDKPTHIRISAREVHKDVLVPRDRGAELWIEQEGLPRFAQPKLSNGSSDENYTKIEGSTETLAYMTLEELLHLRDECNDAIQELVK